MHWIIETSSGGEANNHQLFGDEREQEYEYNDSDEDDLRPPKHMLTVRNPLQDSRARSARDGAQNAVEEHRRSPSAQS